MARKSKHQGTNSSNKRPKVEEKLEDAVWFLKKCNAPAEIIEDAEKILDADTSTLGDVQKILQRALKLLNRHNIANFNILKKEYDAIRKDLEDTLSAIENGKYEGSLNFGDGISLLTCAIIIKHYAPWSCRGYECRRGFVSNLIKRTNQCIVPFLNNIPKSLNKEAGYDWSTEIAKSVDDSVAFVDMRIITPKKKKKCKSEFNTFYKDASITERDANLLGFILYAFHVKAHHVHYGDDSWSIPVACATKEGWEEVFKSSEEVDTGVIKFLKYVAHGQCWAMRLPLMNEDVHTDELLDHYNYALVELYKHVPLLNLPDLSRIAHRFGARCGENLTDEERAERKVCSPSADMKEAWRAYHADEELTPEQQRLVRYGAAVIEAIRAGKAGDTLTTAQQELLKDHHAWLTFEAWNDYHAHGGDMSQLSTEQQELLKDSYFWKVHVAWKEYHANGGHITKLSEEKRELLKNCYFWKLHDEALTKHLKKIEQMKKDDKSNYVQVGDEEVFYIPESEKALHEHVRRLRSLSPDNWKRLKFEQAAGINLSKMEEAYCHVTGKTHQKQADEVLSGTDESNAGKSYELINQIFSSNKNEQRARWTSFAERHRNDKQYHLLAEIREKKKGKKKAVSLDPPSKKAAAMTASNEPLKKCAHCGEDKKFVHFTVGEWNKDGGHCHACEVFELMEQEQYHQQLLIQQQQLIVQQQLNRLQQEQQRQLPFPIQQQQDLDPLLIQQALADFKRMTGREYDGGGQV